MSHNCRGIKMNFWVLLLSRCKHHACNGTEKNERATGEKIQTPIKIVYIIRAKGRVWPDMFESPIKYKNVTTADQVSIAKKNVHTMKWQ